MPIIGKMFWAIAIGVTCLNAYLLRSRAQKEIARNPELAEGYRQLIIGHLILFNLPWLVMGLGILVGGTHNYSTISALAQVILTSLVFM